MQSNSVVQAESPRLMARRICEYLDLLRGNGVRAHEWSETRLLAKEV